jgi:hypothetical protein
MAMRVADCAFLAVVVGLACRTTEQLTKAIRATRLSFFAVGIRFAATLQAGNPNIAGTCITSLDEFVCLAFLLARVLVVCPLHCLALPFEGTLMTATLA